MTQNHINQNASPATQGQTRDTKASRFQHWLHRMYDLGFSYDEADQLRRIQLTLHRWSEQECGDGNDHASWAIERDEVTGKPFRCVYPHNRPSYRTPIADREKGALRRLNALMAKHPRLWAYQQGDPRGCALYVGRLADLPGDFLDSLNSYYTRGVACATN